MSGPSDVDLCRALDALTSTERRGVAVSAAEARDRRVDEGDTRMAAVWNALAVLAAESESAVQGRYAELERQLRWAGEEVVQLPDDAG